ncbi:MAG: hypothetical protein ABF991_09095 [Liquorilactobacillus hordei]|uniref:Uncharacterized protein n=4 Tax=Liquorilactobacillus TaxID=2767888 RepID=A0A3Q8CAN3_9LACO|nr:MULTISPECIES: hypothetical protein [Liquorilactobacillus]AUJ30936.1 hypothetical protein BSQ49_11790 [Liquorilactobacillus hordei]AUJ33282.1 hypothetical protein BSQ50_11565 [Liquorilactobacillus nagelii]EJE97922.1 hypothetical protein LMA_08863 [Liquorilactobacillus mali KCTC 3596 = DSM 20444]MCC7617275.1 hypothetical protein [Liquorilactobacillus nagelii]MDC7954195.1 hypothetical protein [Liquorilactobacillus mali]
MDTNQLTILLLAISGMCAIFFFILLFKMTHLQKELKEMMLKFNQLTVKFKKDNSNNDEDISQLLSIVTYNPAKLLPLIVILNMIPTLVLLAYFNFKTSQYFVYTLLLCFIAAALLLPIYYLYLKKSIANFSLKSKSLKNNTSLSKLISEFDSKLLPVIEKKTFNTLYAFQFLNIAMICCTLLKIILRF